MLDRCLPLLVQTGAPPPCWNSFCRHCIRNNVVFVSGKKGRDRQVNYAVAISVKTSRSVNVCREINVIADEVDFFNLVLISPLLDTICVWTREWQQISFSGDSWVMGLIEHLENDHCSGKFVSPVTVSICEFVVGFGRFLRKKNRGSRFGFGFYGSRF